MNNLKITLAELLDTDNMTIYRNAISILKELKKNTVYNCLLCEKEVHGSPSCTECDDFVKNI